jgi:hypothetical protein
MSRIPDNEKFDKNGRLYVLDDNIPTPEEVEESLKNVPPEKLAQWDRDIEEYRRKHNKGED